MSCFICYEDCNELNNLKCSHSNSFHQECLNKWRKNFCPLCRKSSSNLKDYLLSIAVEDCAIQTIIPTNAKH